jgi:hypothetical protein
MTVPDPLDAAALAAQVTAPDDPSASDVQRLGEYLAAMTIAGHVVERDLGAVLRSVYELEHAGGPSRADPWRLLALVADLTIRYQAPTASVATHSASRGAGD